MAIIESARAFVNRLRQPTNPRVCRHCGYRYTKRNGSYAVMVRDRGGVRQERQQRWWCHRCRRSYDVEAPSRAKWQRYTRRVQRTALDLRLHLGGSLRRTAEWLRAEITPGSGRSRIWDPCRAAAVSPQAKLQHTTLWRWQQRVSWGWQQRQQAAPAVWGGAQWGGRLVADATAVLIHGAWTTLHLIGSAGSGLMVRFQSLTATQRSALRREVQQALAALGATWHDWTDLMTDGASVYQDLLRWDAPHVPAHRCVTHLWRNIHPRLRQYAAAYGEARAEALRGALHLVWDAADLATAQAALHALALDWQDDSWVQAMVQWITPTLAAVLAPRSVAGMPRTTNDAERRFER